MLSLSRLIRGAFVSRAGRSTLWSIGNVALATGVGIISARLLGVDLRGVLGIFVSVAGLAVLVGSLGTNVAVRRLLPRGEVSPKQYLHVSGILFAFHSFLLIGVAWVLARFVDDTFGQPAVFLAFLSYGMVYFWSNQFLDLMNGSGLMVKAAATNMFGTAVCLSAIAVAAILRLGLEAVLFSYVISLFAQIVAGLITLRRSFNGESCRGGRGRLMRLGPKLLGLNFGQAIAYRADTALIGALGSASAAGVYSVATTPAGVLMLPATALSQVMMHDAAAGKISFGRLLRRVAILEVGLGTLVALGWLFADAVVILLFGPDFAEAGGVLRVLLIAQLLLVPFVIFSRVVVACGATWSASLPGVAGAITLIVAGSILIPSLGAYGGAWASVIAYGTMSIISFGQIFRYRHMLQAAKMADPDLLEEDK